MKKLLGVFLLGLLVSSQAVAAPVTWTVSGATFNDGGALNGSFDYDSSTNIYSNISLTTTSGSVLSGDFYPVALPPSSDAGELTLNDGPFQIPTLFLNFGSDLSNAGGTIGFNMDEIDPFDGFRAGTGTVSAVPVPAAVWLFGSGLGLLGWLRRRQSA